MAISDNYNSLTFGGVNSLDYGVYISGPGVYNAPTRAVEFVDVPGRNGAIEIDQGHWNNIEVTYEAGMFADDQADFGEKMNEFRNAIVSQTGYQRLADTYNPEHYRLGIYANGIEVNAVRYNDAAEFTLVFNCKPQRFLLSGENEVDITSGDMIENPTLLNSKPLLMSSGYGAVSVNDTVINIENIVFGDTELYEAVSVPTTLIRQDFDMAVVPLVPRMLNQNDDVYISEIYYTQIFELNPAFESDKRYKVKSVEIANAMTTDGLVSYTCKVVDDTHISVSAKWVPTLEHQYIYSMSWRYKITSDLNKEIRGRFDATIQNVADSSDTKNRFLETNFHANYNGDNSIRYYANIYPQTGFTCISSNITYGILRANSTALALTDPVYIDMETGDCYGYDGDNVISENKYVNLPADLIELVPGDNEIVFDNTISDLKIIPRWWEL